MTRTAALALVLAVSAVVLAAPTRAEAGRGMEVAVQDDGLFLYGADYMGIDPAYRLARDMRASRIRMNVLWGYAVTASQRHLKRKPRAVVYDFGIFDRAIRDARRRGMKVQLTLSGPAPAWATPKNKLSKGHWKPSVRKFKQFVKAFAKRYRRSVDRFSIWNEPNWYKWLGPLRQAPQRYRKLYKAAYKVIRRKAPRAKILLGELSPNKQRGIAIAPLKFLRRMTCLNDDYRKKRRLSRRRCRSKLRADGVAHHPYDFDKPPWKNIRGRDNVTIATLPRLTRALDKMKRRRVLVRRGGGTMPVHLTEYGYHRSGHRRVPERRRARWERRAFEIAYKNRRVKTMLHYYFVRQPDSDFFDLSIVNADGSKTRTYNKLRRWTRNHKLDRPGRWRAG
jgi:hypothetical protein